MTTAGTITPVFLTDGTPRYDPRDLLDMLDRLKAEQAENYANPNS